MPQYRVTVTEFYPPETATEVAIAIKDQATCSGREVYSQVFNEGDFDVQGVALALNKRRRVRKARGKETN